MDYPRILLLLVIAALLIGITAGATWWLVRWNYQQLLAAARADMTQTLNAVKTTLTRREEELIAHKRALATVDHELNELKQMNDTLSAENGELRLELGRRVELRNVDYRVVVIGITGTGKTRLMKKWANPLWEGEPDPTMRLDNFSASLAMVRDHNSGVLVNHVLNVFDFGGEEWGRWNDTLVDAQANALIIVVDLHGRDAVPGGDPARVRHQINEYPEPLVRIIFSSPKTTATCRAILLFINKSDCISGTTAEIEQRAREHYAEFIALLERLSEKYHIDLNVVVGSALSGHNLHRLSPYFADRLLPDEVKESEAQRQHAQSSV